ncbi:MAG: hypothetical protein CVU47_13095 [Chloroflexi bacterium HGW-Chloroflexi-9]|nr:MAG: hypothetical protein CVU47_13095 [Chloroflexi bacterium HGW-Chloroflexi-9]
MMLRVKSAADLSPSVLAALRAQGVDLEADTTPEPSPADPRDVSAHAGGWGFHAAFRSTVMVYLGGVVALALLRGVLG